MKYERPTITVQNDLTEGVYTASGDIVCQSKYMNGNHQDPVTNTYGVEIARKDRGCEGCPADQGGECRLDLGPFGSPLMPTWERNGNSPDDRYIYWG